MWADFRKNSETNRYHVKAKTVDRFTTATKETDLGIDNETKERKIIHIHFAIKVATVEVAVGRKTEFV